MTISTNTEALNATALATRAIHAGQESDPTTGAVVTPSMTSTFKQDGVGGLRNGYDYSRSINPTRNSFDEQPPPWKARNTVKLLLRTCRHRRAAALHFEARRQHPARQRRCTRHLPSASKVFVPWGIGLDVVDITDTAAVSAALAKKQYAYIWWKPRPTRCSTSPTSPPPRPWRTRTAPKWSWTTPSHPRYCSIRSQTAPTWSSTPPPSTSAATLTWSAARWS